MGIFKAAHGCRGGRGGGGGGAKRSPPPSLKSVTHMLHLAHSYTLPKEDPKNIYQYINHDISIFHWKSANFAISRNIDIDFILIYNF